MSNHQNRVDRGIGTLVGQNQLGEIWSELRDQHVKRVCALDSNQDSPAKRHKTKPTEELSDAAPSFIESTRTRSPIVQAPARPKTILRARVVDMMVRVFEGTLEAEDAGLRLEHAMNEYACVDGVLNEASYKELFKVLKINLSRNQELRDAILEQSLSCDDLVRMDAKGMITKENLARIENLQKESWRDAQVAKVPMDETDQFQCGRCKKKRCVYFQKQTRSADEPMTTFVQCKECGKMWRC